MISVRLAPDEAEAIRAAADREGRSVSAFLRAAALKEARQEDSPRAHPNPVPYLVNVPATYNWSDVAVTVLSASSPQDIEKIGGRGLSAQSSALGGR
jgi:hypothetical protein